MVTEIAVQGFKSFGEPGPNLPLSNLNFLVGANASGKSNFVSALKFIQDAVMLNVDYAVSELGGVTEVRNKILRQRTVKKPVVFELIVVPTQQVPRMGGKSTVSKIKYTLMLDLRNDTAAPVIQKEELSAEMNGQSEFSNFWLRRDTDKITSRNSPDEAEQTFPIPDEERNRLILGIGFFWPAVVTLRNEIESWRFFNVSPEVARRPYKAVPKVGLGSSGQQLAVVLNEIQRNKKALNSVVQGLIGAVQGFRNIKTMKLPVEGTWAFQVIEEGIRGAINPESVSDGTVRLLALLVITNWVSKSASLIAIEEPENGLHPHLSEYIVEILRSASQEKQFIITTHNPAFLDYLEPSEVYLCDKVNSFTLIKRASEVDQIEVFRKKFRLGELWVQGTLGGVL
jgi:predicted ATPase